MLDDALDRSQSLIHQVSDSNPCDEDEMFNKVQKSQSLIHQVSDSNAVYLKLQEIERLCLNPFFIRSQIRTIENGFKISGITKSQSLIHQVSDSNKEIQSTTNKRSVNSLNPLFIRSQIRTVMLFTCLFIFAKGLNPLFIRSQIRTG